MADLLPVLADLQAESAELDALVSVLPADAWATPTPAAGWTIADQVAHLAWTDDATTMAATNPKAFRALLDKALTDIDHFVDAAAAQRSELEPAVLLHGWRAGRGALAAALSAAPAGEKIIWFGPPMSPTSMATARLMETWAHGQDVADALGASRLPTQRLRHISHLGVRTRDFAYLIRDRTPPAEAFRVELTAPDGSTWSWGPDDATQSVTGPALDFCLRVTQRRHLDELDLVAVGPDATAWLDIAQAFAGPPGRGRGRVRDNGEPS